MFDAERDTAQAIMDLISRDTPKTAGSAVGLGEIEADSPPPTTSAAAPG
jgi:hypothetical protein